MTNFNTLEELRTKEELVNYFAQRGQSITEEEIEALKKNYEQAENKSGTLSLEQLDDVAGGLKINIVQKPFSVESCCNKRILTIKDGSRIKKVIYGPFKNVVYQVIDDGENSIRVRYSGKYSHEGEILGEGRKERAEIIAYILTNLKDIYFIDGYNVLGSTKTEKSLIEQQLEEEYLRATYTVYR